jgi:hypothetical protein
MKAMQGSPLSLPTMTKCILTVGNNIYFVPVCATNCKGYIKPNNFRDVINSFLI